jgi:hypothetical protein
MAIDDAPPKPTPRADPRVLARILEGIGHLDPEEGLTGWIDPVKLDGLTDLHLDLHRRRTQRKAPRELPPPGPFRRARTTTSKATATERKP